MPQFGRAIIISGFKNSKYHPTGKALTVTDFACLTRLEFSDIPHESPFANKK